MVVVIYLKLYILYLFIHLWWLWWVFSSVWIIVCLWCIHVHAYIWSLFWREEGGWDRASCFRDSWWWWVTGIVVVMWCFLMSTSHAWERHIHLRMKRLSSVYSRISYFFFSAWYCGTSRVSITCQTISSFIYISIKVHVCMENATYIYNIHIFIYI